MGLILLVALFAYLIIEARRCPSIVLVAVFCQYGIEQWMGSQYTFFYINSSVLNVAVGLLVLWGIFLRVKSSNSFILFQNFPVVGILSILLFLYALLSGLWSPAVETGDFAAEWGRNYLYIIVNVAVAPLLLQHSSELKKTILCLCYVGGAISLYLLLFGEWENRAIVMATGAAGTLDTSNPLAIATVGSYALLAAAVYTRQVENMMYKLALVAVAVCSVVFIIRTGSRGQLIGALVAALFVWPMAYRVANPKAFLGFVVMVGFLLSAVVWGLEQYWSFAGAGSRMSMDAVDDRVDLTFGLGGKILEEAWSDPLTTVFGLGSTASYTIIGFYSHITPVEILAEEGIVGFGIFVALLIMTFGKAVQAMKTVHNLEQRMALAFFAGVIVLELILSVKQGYLLGSGILFMNCILMAKLCRIIEKENKKNQMVERVKHILLDNQAVPA